MEIKRLKVKCIKTYPHFEDMFEEGDIVTMIVNGYDKDTLLVNPQYEFDMKTQMYKRDKNNNVIKIPDTEVIAKKGSAKNITIELADGRRYPDSTLLGAIGYNWLSKLFIKV